MLKLYFKTAFRNMMRNKTFSGLNIGGLAISLAAFILMALYIEDEMSFDHFNKNKDRTYRVVDDKTTPDVMIPSAQTAAPVAPFLKKDFPEIQQTVRLIKTESLLKYNNKIFEERNIYYSDPSIFEIFSFPLLQGNAEKALKYPEQIVVTSRASQKYFGNNTALGQMILVNGKPHKVTGVMADIPVNSHLQFDFLISMSTAEQKNSGYDWLFTNWYSNNFFTYIMVPENYNINKLKRQMPSFDERYKEAGGVTTHHYDFEKLSDIYLYSDRQNQAGETGSITKIYIFSAIALFILILACINFINLSTAKSAYRAKEVGVKKVAGATRRQLTAQFITESFLMCGVALLIAIFFTHQLLPFFSDFSGKSLSQGLFTLKHLAFLLGLLLILGLLTGTYPAFVLSSFKPAVGLKGKFSSSGRSILVRKGLVVFQFAVSVSLIICSLVVYQQMNYLQKHELGFEPAQTMIINFEGDADVKRRLKTIKQELLSVPGVKEIAASSNVPGDGNAGTWSMDFLRLNGDTIHTELAIYLTDYNYLDLYQIKVAAGRGFSENYPVDQTESLLINQVALKQLGFRSAEEAIGTSVAMYPKNAKIIGVINDFHFETLQKTVAPLAMRVLPDNYRLFSLKINTATIKETIASLENKWKTLVPDRPLEFTFLEETFNRQYHAEMKFGKVFTVFAILAVIIASLGLFGLTMASVQQRTKEIGVRKVLGATTLNIAFGLSTAFLKLIIIGVVIAIPIAYYFMESWLNNFAIRINLSMWIFITAALSTLAIAVGTISFQSIKAGTSNPVNSLRAE